MLVAGGDSSEWVRSRFGAAVGDGRGAFRRVVHGRCRGVAAVVVALLVAGVLVPAAAGPAAAQTPATVVDYDVDDDGLIEISSLAHLNAVRWDLDGDGTADVYPADQNGVTGHDPDGATKHAAAFADAVAGMGCPAGGCVGYELIADLDFDTNGSGGADSGDDYWNGGKGWAPLMGGEAIYGWYTSPRYSRLQDQVGRSYYGDRPNPRARMFTGVFEGNGRTIANLYINDAGRSYVGLFGYIGPGAKVRNFGLTAPNSDSGVRGRFNAGALAGSVERARVSGVYSHIDVTGDSDVGGLVGANWRYGFIIESYATGDVAGKKYAGGLAGLLNLSGAAASYATGDVTVECFAGGGLSGYRPSGHVRATYATGSVTLTGHDCETVRVGGLIGWLTYPSEQAWMRASYATGPVSVPQGRSGRGGLTGECDSSTRPRDDGANYWDVEASGMATSPDCGVGYTTAQLQAPTGYTGIYADWNVDVNVGAYVNPDVYHGRFDGAGDDPWDFGTSSQYPVLKYCAAKPGIQTADGSAYCPLQPDAQRSSRVPGAQSAPVTPEVGITSSVGGTEGATVSFTLTAVPAPAADLDVDVSVVTSGDFGYGPIPATVTIPTGGAATVTVTTVDDSVDELDGSVTLTVDTGSGYTVSATQGTAAVDVADDDDAPLPRSAQNAPALDAQLEADVRSYAAETQHGTLHVNRWKRVLEAFGLEDYAGLEPTTLDEARVHVDIGRPRWIPVLAHMAAMDAANPQPPPARGSVQVDAQVLATARSKAAQTHGGVKHMNRWKRVLEAFGDEDYPGVEPLTAAGAQVYANVWSGWDQVAAQLRLIEAAATTDPTPVIPPVVVAATPVVGITSSVGGTEGATVSFTLTASPVPAADLDVDVSVVTSGDFGYGPAPATVTIPTGGTATVSITTADDSADEPDGSVTLTIDAGSGYTVSATQGTAAVVVADDDDAPSPSSAQNAPALDTQLEADVRSYAAETQHGTLHVNRWKRVLEAFGLEDYAGLEPTTLDEARVHVDIGRPRWIPVLAHMVAMDAVNPQPPPTRGSVQVDAQVLATARSKAAQTHGGEKHVNRWKRVLEAFGDGDYPGIEPLTAAGAQVYANVWSGWDQVAAQLRLIESAADPTPVIPPVVVAPTPEVSITSSAGGTEGDTVTFTLTASPVPAADLDVDVSVVTSGDFGYGPAPATVTIPTSGTATVSITTADDSTDEPDGSVTLTINAGSGYTVGASASDSADVVDDDPVAPVVVVPDPVVSITAGQGVTEGGDASFTVTAVPAPASGLPVTVTVAQNGAFGAVTGSRTVTVPTGGSVSFTVATTDDSADESDGSVTATVNTGSGYTVSAGQGAGTVNVSDNDVPQISITAGQGVTEGGDAGFTLTAVPAPATALDVAVTITQNGDYGAVTGSRTVTVPTGGSVSFAVATTDDSADESDGSVTATVNTGSGYTVSTSHSAGTVSVADNDVPQISITEGQGVTEGGNATFTLTAVPAPATALDVAVTITQNGDYGAVTGPRTVTVPTSGSVSFTVATTDDATDESDGSVTVTVDDSSGYTVSSRNTGTVNVADNDDPPPTSAVSVSVADATGSEADWAVVFTVTLSEASTEEVRVRFTTWNWLGLTGRAKIWLDYQSTERTIVFTPGQTEQTVTVWLIDDYRPEPDEYFTVELTNPQGATIGRGAATGTITDDD